LGIEKTSPPPDPWRRDKETEESEDGTLQPLAGSGGRCGGRYDGWVNTWVPPEQRTLFPPLRNEWFFIRPALFLGRGGYGGESAMDG